MTPFLAFCFAMMLQPASAVRLTSTRYTAQLTSSLDRQGTWWFKVGNDVYHKPHVSLLGLGQEVTDYYHALGSESALSDEMRAKRVGGQGRNHIFFLPDGPSSLKNITYAGGRRSSFSALTQLKAGVVFDTSFPVFVYDRASYRNPLVSEAEKDVEKSIVDGVTGKGAMQYLRQLLAAARENGSESDGGPATRSWSNKKASHAAIKFLQDEAKSMKLTTCLDHFKYSSMMGMQKTQLTNVVAFVQGTGSGTVTVGAHYDSRPFRGLAPGANDNGSGSAGLLEIAKQFAKAVEEGLKPKKSVYFVWFAGEEQGLLGSENFAKLLLKGGLPAECTARKTNSFLAAGATESPSQHQAIIMDEIGWKSSKAKGPKVNMESLDHLTGEVLKHMADASYTHNGDLLTIEHSNNPFGSDHMSWLNRGMPAVLAINFDDEAYPAYHKSSDSMNNVDKELVGLVAKMNAGALVRMAGVSVSAKSSSLGDV